MKSEDLHWLSGILEGDGSFGVSKGKYPRLVVAMCDYEIVDRVSQLVGLGIREYKTPKGKPFYSVTWLGAYAAYWMKKLRPLMGSRRKKQIDNALSKSNGKISATPFRHLQAEEVREIRKMASAGMNYSQIARLAGREQSTISRIARRKTHKNVD